MPTVYTASLTIYILMYIFNVYHNDFCLEYTFSDFQWRLFHSITEVEEIIVNITAYIQSIRGLMVV